MKTYGLRVLEDLCGGTEGCVERVLTWNELHPDGLRVKGAPLLAVDRDAGTLLAGAELKTWRWQASADGPALPIPFTARQLAAFWLAGGGLFLFERFDGGEKVDSAALDGLHDAVRELVCAAHSLRTQARDRFFPNLVDEARSYRDDDRKANVIFYKDHGGDAVQAAADWLLTEELVAPAMPKALPRQRAQEQAIVAALALLGYDPFNLPPPPPGKTAEAKQRVRAHLNYSKAVMNKAWLRLSKEGAIGYSR